MNNISDKKYIRVFFTFLKLKNDINLLAPSKEEMNYITNIIYILDTFSKDLFGFDYELDNGQIISRQVANSINFIKADFDGILLDIVGLEDKYKEEIELWKLSDNIGNDNLLNTEFINNLAVALYLKTTTQSKNFGEAKKKIIKEKNDEGINFEDMKYIWKTLNELYNKYQKKPL